VVDPTRFARGTPLTLGNKTMLPPHASWISRILAHVVVGSAGLLYFQKLFWGPGEDFYTFAVTASGLIGGISALCYTKASVTDDTKDKGTMVFCGEKFFHSSLLMLQALVLKYVYDGVLPFFPDASWWKTILSLVFFPLYLATGIYGFYGVFHAFDDLNEFLWKRYVERWKQKKDRMP
jgi:hypothetical protein